MGHDAHQVLVRRNATGQQRILSALVDRRAHTRRGLVRADVPCAQPPASGTQIFVRQFSQFRPAVEVFVEEMEDVPAQEVERVAKELNGALGTLVLEALTSEQLRELVCALREPST
jgi:hypothetical protein